MPAAVTSSTQRQDRRWGWRLLVLVLAVGWAVLRLGMNREFKGAPWAALLSLDAPLPFGHRVLVPLAARPLVALGIDIRIAWGVFEVISMVALVLVLDRLFSRYMPSKPARLLATAIFFVLPMAYLLPHRWPIFYPWDAPAMSFVAAGVALAVERRFAAVCVLTALAAFNRESALLLPASVAVLTMHDAKARKRALPWTGLMIVVYVCVRWGIALALPDNRGPALHFALEERYRLFNNLEWLAHPANAVRFVGSLAFLPVLWPVVRRHVPADLGRLHVPALAMLLGLTLVANVYEPRAFGEVIILAWIGVASGLGRWLGEDAGSKSALPRSAWLVLFDRTAAFIIVLLWVLFSLALHRWAFVPLVP